jgi:hypothetical protein
MPLSNPIAAVPAPRKGWHGGDEQGYQWHWVAECVLVFRLNLLGADRFQGQPHLNHDDCKTAAISAELRPGVGHALFVTKDRRSFLHLQHQLYKAACQSVIRS